MSAASDHIKFDDFCLDLRNEQLLRGDARIHLTPKAFSVLRHLALAADSLVTREALFAEHWSGQIVTDDALTRSVREIRKALGDSSQQPRFIVTEHRRGFRFIARTERSSTVVSPSENSSTRSTVGGVTAVDAGEFALADAILGRHANVRSDALAGRDPSEADPFVGREAFLQPLWPALAALPRERRGLILSVSGEAGIGKSRLLTHVAERARGLGIHCVTVQVGQLLGAPPQWAWIQMLRGLPGAASPHSLNLRELLPDWHADVAPLAATTVDLRDARLAARFALHDALARALRQAAHMTPLLLIFEDLHDGDDDTLAALAYIASSITDLPVALAVSWRDVGTESNQSMRGCIAALARAGCTYIPMPLRGFDEAEMQMWLHSHTVAQQPQVADTVQRLRDQTGGNPLFLTELHALAAGGATHPALSRPDASDNLQQVLEHRLARLNQPTRAVLELAAAAGRVFSAAVLARCAGVSALQVEQALQDARADRLITALPESGRWGFTHGLVRDALDAASSAEARQHRHEQLALALETMYSRATGAVTVEQLAQHFLAAQPTAGNLSKAAKYLRLATDEAFAVCAFADAARYANALLDDVLSAQPKIDDTELGAQALLCARIEAHAGHPDRARALARRALVHARQGTDTNLFGLAVAVVCDFAPSYPIDAELLQLIEEALAQVADVPEPAAERVPRPAIHARLLAQRSLQHYLRGHREAQLRDAEAALVLARSTHDDDAIEGALAALSHALNQMQHAEHWSAVTDERIALATRRRDRHSEFIARRQRLEQLMQAGAMRAVEDELVRWRVVVDRLGSPSANASLLRTEACLAISRGEFDRAEQRVRQAQAVGQQSIDASAADALALLQMGALMALRGHAATLLTALRANRGASGQISLFAAAEVYACALRGEVDNANAELGRLCSVDFADVPRDSAYSVALCYLTMAIERLQHREAAERVYPLLQPYAGRNVTVVTYFSSGCASSYLGRLATVMRDWRLANDCFDVALQVEARSGFVVWQAATSAAYARSLRTRGDPSLRVRAEALDVDAQRLAAAHGFMVPS